MIAYMDRTFCISPNCQNKCGRKLTQKVREDAERWWGGSDAPISVGKFCENTTEDGEVNHERD